MEGKDKQTFAFWLKTIQSFSKWITFVWIALWVEVVLFSQLAVILQFGDTQAISTINDNVLQIGLVICSFYFSTKCIENVAKGIEYYLAIKEGRTIEIKNITNENFDEDSEDDSMLSSG